MLIFYFWDKEIVVISVSRNIVTSANTMKATKPDKLVGVFTAKTGGSQDRGTNNRPFGFYEIFYFFYPAISYKLPPKRTVLSMRLYVLILIE